MELQELTEQLVLRVQAELQVPRARQVRLQLFLEPRAQVALLEVQARQGLLVQRARQEL